MPKAIQRKPKAATRPKNGKIVKALKAEDAEDGVVLTADDKGRVLLGGIFAKRMVIVEKVSDTELVVKLIAKREEWVFKNPEALASLRRGLADARAGRVAPAPDLEAANALAEQLED